MEGPRAVKIDEDVFAYAANAHDPRVGQLGFEMGRILRTAYAWAQNPGGNDGGIRGELFPQTPANRFHFR
jgi:hypothetical protein